MNFKQFIIESMTISQSFKNSSIPPETIKNVKQTSLDTLKTRGNFAVLANNKKLVPILLNWIAYNAIENYRNSMFFQKANNFNDINGWTRNFIVNIWNNIADYIITHTNDNQLLSNLNRTDYSLENLIHASQEWHEKLKLQKSVPGAAGETIIKLDDIGMAGWTWVSLGRGYCPQEAKAGGHCGNSGARNSDNIISLRDPQQKVHLTFVVNNKVLGEAKGRFNQKPTEQYHKAITKLLLSPYVDTIKGGGYAPEMNFHFDDLTEQEQKLILSKKPHMASYVNYALSNLDTNKIYDLTNTEVQSITGDRIIIDKADDLAGLNKIITSNDVNDFGWLEDPDPINVDVSDKEAIDAIDDYASKENKQLINKIFADNNVEFDINTEDISLSDDDISEEIINASRSALMNAIESGILSEAYKNLSHQLESVTKNGFWIDMKSLTTNITVSSLKDLYVKEHEYFQRGENLSYFYDFKYNPNRGYSGGGWDTKEFNELLANELNEIL